MVLSVVFANYPSTGAQDHRLLGRCFATPVKAVRRTVFLPRYCHALVIWLSGDNVWPAQVSLELKYDCNSPSLLEQHKIEQVLGTGPFRVPIILFELDCPQTGCEDGRWLC